jgi:hypothetical protein
LIKIKMERAKEFIKEHKTAVMITGAAVAGLAGGYYYIKRYNNSK